MRGSSPPKSPIEGGRLAWIWKRAGVLKRHIQFQSSPSSAIRQPIRAYSQFYLWTTSTRIIFFANVSLKKIMRPELLSQLQLQHPLVVVVVVVVVL